MGKIAANAIMGLCVVLPFLWSVLALLPGGWQTKLGTFASFEVGLYSISIKPTQNSWLNAGGNVIGGIYDKKGGKYSLMHHKESMCELGNNRQRVASAVNSATNIMSTFAATLATTAGSFVPSYDEMCPSSTHLLYFSNILCVCLFFCVIALATGGISIYLYYKDAAREKTRKIAEVSFAIAAFMPLLGMLAYTFGTAKTWRWMGNAGSSGSSMPFGMSYWFAWLLVIFTWIPFLITFAFAKTKLFEEYNEIMSMEKKEQQREQIALLAEQGVQPYGGQLASGQYGGQAVPHGQPPNQWDPASQQYGQQYAQPPLGQQFQQPPVSQQYGVGPPPYSQ